MQCLPCAAQAPQRRVRCSPCRSRTAAEGSGGAEPAGRQAGRHAAQRRSLFPPAQRAPSSARLATRRSHPPPPWMRWGSLPACSGSLLAPAAASRPPGQTLEESLDRAPLEKRGGTEPGHHRPSLAAGAAAAAALTSPAELRALSVRAEQTPQQVRWRRPLLACMQPLFAALLQFSFLPLFLSLCLSASR